MRSHLSPVTFELEGGCQSEGKYLRAINWKPIFPVALTKETTCLYQTKGEIPTPSLKESLCCNILPFVVTRKLFAFLLLDRQHGWVFEALKSMRFLVPQSYTMLRSWLGPSCEPVCWRQALTEILVYWTVYWILQSKITGICLTNIWPM